MKVSLGATACPRGGNDEHCRVACSFTAKWTLHTMSSFIASTCPALAATCKGLARPLVSASGSAPATSSRRMASTCPCPAATWRGRDPCRSSGSTRACQIFKHNAQTRRHSVKTRLPVDNAAHHPKLCDGYRQVEKANTNGGTRTARAFGLSLPCGSSRFMASRCPPRAAKCSAVRPR